MFILAAGILFAAAAFIRIEKRIKPVAELQAEHIAQKTANEIIEASVSDYLDKNRFTYNDFSAVLYNDRQEAVSIETIPYNINKVQSELTLLINKNLEKEGQLSGRIALGSLTDSHFFTGKGPRLKIKVAPIGSAKVHLKSDFQSAGINQTCHRISAVISVDMTSSVPLYSFDTHSEYEFILAENIIVGNVPELSPYISTKA